MRELHPRLPNPDKHPPIAPLDTALIEHAMGTVLRSLYDGVAREPMPDRIKALLDELARKSAARGR